MLAGVSRRLAAFYQRPEVQMYGLLVVLLIFFTTLDAPLQRGVLNASRGYVDWVTELLLRSSGGAGA